MTPNILAPVLSAQQQQHRKISPPFSSSSSSSSSSSPLGPAVAATATSSTPSLSPVPQLSSASVSAPKRRRRVIYLGVPTLDRIDATDLLDAPALAPPYRFLSVSSPPSESGPNWRILYRTPKRLKTGITQNSYSSTAVSTPQYTPTAESGIQHPSSAEGTFDSLLSGNSVYTQDIGGDTMFLSEDEHSFLSATQDPDRPPLPPLVSLTDLEDLPRAHAVASVPANSLSITAIVAVLSISDPRAVTTRFGRNAQVVTLTVGDPTRAPFRIDAWLEPRPKNVDEMELKAVVRDLRVQDIIVVKNLRLGTWKDLVYGTTWRVGSRGGTFVWVVHRTRYEDAEECRRWRRRWDEDILAEKKVARTVGWVEQFVGPGLGGTNRGGMLEEEEMPQDTPGNVSF